MEVKGEDLWAAINRGTQNLASHWASYTVLFSFFLYVIGYLALRFHLTALGVGTDLSVIDERYLFTGNKFLIYLVSLVPSLLLLILVSFLSVVAPIYLLYRLLPRGFRVKLGNFYQRQWQNFQSWWLASNRLAWLGILFTLLIIQLVMRQSILLSNLLLAGDLPAEPLWLRYLLLAKTDGPMTLYFISLLGGVLASASIFFYTLRNSSNQMIRSGITRLLLGFLLGVQLLLLPVNYGILVLDKSMPRVNGLDTLGVLKPDDQAWLVWEGNEGKTFLLRKQQGGNYKRSLMTLPKNDTQRMEITGYDHIFKFLFSSTSSKEEG
ncbi:MAG TPA: hypothetical protein PKG49_07845 [Nitrosomonas mobilis]|nr:hypothetical protein [Nitrosomonas mobilis]